MSCRITEDIEIKTVIAPVSQTAGGNTIGAYLPMPSSPSGFESIDFVIRTGALAAGKKITVEVLEADDDSGTNASAIEGYAVEHTAGDGGEAETEVKVWLVNADVKKDFVTIKVTNDNGAALPLDAFALTRKVFSN